MRQVFFQKYQGGGNDFILLDNRDDRYSDLSIISIKKLCDRHFGIGSDGFIFINKHPQLDFDMQFYNPDGTRSFCGNGARCAVAFYSVLVSRIGQFTFDAFDGLHTAELMENGMVRLEMNDVDEIIKHSDQSYELYTGSPHLIKFESNIENIDVQQQGAKIRYSEKYIKEGINVNFIEVIDNQSILIRTYERGVEHETLACGTGITAASLAFAKNVKMSGFNRVKVNARGGQLFVEFNSKDNHFVNIILEGPASFVFKGEIYV